MRNHPTALKDSLWDQRRNSLQVGCLPCLLRELRCRGRMHRTAYPKLTTLDLNLIFQGREGYSKTGVQDACVRGDGHTCVSQLSMLFAITEAHVNLTGDTGSIFHRKCILCRGQPFPTQPIKLPSAPSLPFPKCPPHSGRFGESFLDLIC